MSENPHNLAHNLTFAANEMVRMDSPEPSFAHISNLMMQKSENSEFANNVFALHIVETLAKKNLSSQSLESIDWEKEFPNVEFCRTPQEYFKKISLHGNKTTKNPLYVYP